MSINNDDHHMTRYEMGRNISLFLIGAVILVLEIEWHEHTRGWVIALSLLLMGIVTVDQVRKWFEGKHADAITDGANVGKWPTTKPTDPTPKDPPL
jgi:hypothetical protein